MLTLLSFCNRNSVNKALVEKKKATKEEKKEMGKILRSAIKIRTSEAAMFKQYEFWNTQPVPKFNEDVMVNQAIEKDIPLSEVRQEPYTLPQGFKWDTLSLDNPQILQELYQFLKENYVGDDYNTFRLDYSVEFLLWVLKPPGWLKETHCGIRSEKSGKLVGFISGIPALIRIFNDTKTMGEANFLCVHKKLQSKRVAPVLMREIRRRGQLNDFFQAVYTAEVLFPKPVSTCRYWHRALNPKKLIDVSFLPLTRNMTMQRTLKLYRLPEEIKTPGFRVMGHKDIEQAHRLLNKYLSKFDLAPCFNEEAFRYWFLPRPGIVNCYVVENNDGIITDLVSYYTLPSTVLNHPVHKSLKMAYSFYNVSSTTSWCQLMGDALITAKNAGFDVFNALDIMENKMFLEPLKFGIGDCILHYYLYNWRCPSMEPQQIGLILQ